MKELSPCITKYVLVGLEAFYMTSFSWGFYFNKIKFLTEKNKQLKKSQKENLKRKRKKHYACKWLDENWCYMHMYDEESFVLLNLKHVKMIHFSTPHNHKKFVRASWNEAHSIPACL